MDDERLLEAILGEVPGIEVEPDAWYVDMRSMNDRQAGRWLLEAPLIGMDVPVGHVRKEGQIVRFAKGRKGWGNALPLDRVGPELFASMAQLFGARVIRVATWRQMYRFEVIELVERTASAINESPLREDKVHQAIAESARALVAEGRGSAIFLSISVEDKYRTTWMQGRKLLVREVDGKPFETRGHAE